MHVAELFTLHSGVSSPVPPTVVDVLSELADRFGVSQIQLPGDNLGSLHLPHDVTDSLFCFGHVSARQDHPGT